MKDVKMKHLVKSIVAATALAAASGVNADLMADLCPVIGIDYYQVWMKGNNAYSRLTPKSYPGASIYVGTRFYENFGLELGYDWSTRKKHSWTVPAGATAAAGNITGTTKIRRNGGHLDLVGFLPVADCFDVFGSIGYGWVQTKISNSASGNSAMSSAIASISSKGKSVLRLGIGANYMVTDFVGIRGKLGWETTSNIRLKGNANFTNLGFSKKGFKDSGTLALGAFVKF
jgi:hypothetical protein